MAHASRVPTRGSAAAKSDEALLLQSTRSKKTPLWTRSLASTQQLCLTTGSPCVLSHLASSRRGYPCRQRSWPIRNSGWGSSPPSKFQGKGIRKKKISRGSAGDKSPAEVALAPPPLPAHADAPFSLPSSPSRVCIIAGSH